jgi:hypothetical protein
MKTILNKRKNELNLKNDSTSQDRKILIMDFAHELNTKCLDL